MSADLVDRFREVYESLAGRVHLAKNIREAGAIVARVAAGAEARRIALSVEDAALARAIEDACADAVEVLSSPFQKDALTGRIDSSDIGVTDAAFAVAEAGALVEFATNDAKRLVSTLPRLHIGIVLASEVVETLKEAGPRIRVFMEEHPEHATVTFISGPSRTADIEMKLALGVHGPERAETILLG